MTGQKHTSELPINERLVPLLDEAWLTGFSVSSNFARANAELVGMAASLQLITTRVTKDVFSREWNITSKGLRWLNEYKDSE